MDTLLEYNQNDFQYNPNNKTQKRPHKQREQQSSFPTLQFPSITPELQKHIQTTLTRGIN